MQVLTLGMILELFCAFPGREGFVFFGTMVKFPLINLFVFKIIPFLLNMYTCLFQNTISMELCVLQSRHLDYRINTLQINAIAFLYVMILLIQVLLVLSLGLHLPPN